MKTRTDGNVLVVTELDRLSATNSAHFRELVKAVLTDAQSVVEVDCAQMKFIDSEGLGALVSVHKLVAPRKGCVRLTRVPALVRQLLELVKFHEFLEIAD